MSVSTAGQPQRIPLECILLPRNVPAGLSPWILFAIADSLRNAGADVRDPILVQRLIGLDLWRIVDGRHRYCAAVMAGVKDILAREVP